MTKRRPQPARKTVTKRAVKRVTKHAGKRNTKRAAIEMTPRPGPADAFVTAIEPVATAAAPAVVLAVAPAIVAAEESTARVGPLLLETIRGLSGTGTRTGMARMALDMSESDAVEPALPLAMTLPPIEPEPGERWPHYKERVVNTLGPVREWLQQNAGLTCEQLVAGNGLRARGLVGQAQEAAKLVGLRLVELDPPAVVTTMDDAVGDVELALFQLHHPNVDGSGVRIAVLDSGIDTRHPWLQVGDSVSTCGEPIEIPGLHGTHVAGSIASRDTVYRGIAPGVTLLNIKVLQSTGAGQPSFISSGVDEALDRDAHILNMSVGFNHLPTWSQRGHGWICPDGRCQLCTAVNHAVRLENVVVVVAAGNEHDRATFLRNHNLGHTFDSEIACPGAADLAITVGALTKQTFLTASFSSRGPTAFSSSKPDISAPGVNITSARPVRRGSDGQPLQNQARADLSRSSSGTSMATPIVAGAAALILQRRRAAGEDTGQAAVRQELLTRGFKHLASPGTEVGAGRLNLAGL
jgi:serine protease AprX